MLKEIKWWFRMKYQKITRGFTDEELWNLDCTFIDWIIPRLKVFKKKTTGYPCDINSPEEWDEILDKIIKSFELYKDDSEFDLESIKKNNEIIKEGFKLFAERIHNLWW